MSANEVLGLKTAVIGIGSNSLRMLVADIENGEIVRSKRYREGLRVFAALDEAGNITAEMIQKACESVQTFHKEAQTLGVSRTYLFATSAVRDANNQAAFSEALKKVSGLDMEVCSGEMEAQLSFIGATEGGYAGMIDIGGGSTEIALGHGSTVEQNVSLQMGAVRLNRMIPIQSVADAYHVVDLAADILAPQKACFETAASCKWTGVGGTFTTSAALVQRIPWQNREHIHGFVLTRETVASTMEYLAPMPLTERTALACMQPQRADIVVHGIAILLSCMCGLNIPSITVSEHGNLEGYLKVKHHLLERK